MSDWASMCFLPLPPLLSVHMARLLVLAGTGRLNEELMIKQMRRQGHMLQEVVQSTTTVRFRSNLLKHCPASRPYNPTRGIGRILEED